MIYYNSQWKKSSLGLDIPLASSAEFGALQKQKPIVLIGGVHGDEPEGVELARCTLDWLSKHPSSGLAPWLVIPCLNVDGFKAQQRVNGRGVDLNRNYPSSDWSAQFSKDRYFPGTHPGSELEVQAVVELIQFLSPRLLIHCHSWEPCIVCTGDLGWKDAERLAQSSGYKATRDIGYPTPGSLSSYAWHYKRIPVICIEERDGNSDLSGIWSRFESGIVKIFSDLSYRESV